jgi:hypothetical protein
MEIIKDRGNPLIVISPEEVLKWLRQKADEAGFKGHHMQAMQAGFRKKEPPLFLWEPPELLIMVSSEPDEH